MSTKGQLTYTYNTKNT